MESKTVGLVIRYRGLDGKWHRSQVSRGGNGRVKPDCALVDGKVVAVVGGAYELRSYEGRKVKYTPAGKNATDADAQRARQAQVETAKLVAEDAGLKVETETERTMLKGSAATYIADCEGRGAMTAARMARETTSEYLRLTKKTFVDEVRKDDFYKFHAALRKRGCSDRTVYNKHCRAVSWLKFAGIDITHVPPRPKYEASLPTVYDPAEYNALLEKADPYMRILILLALKTGLRDQELQHLEWTDLNIEQRTLLVKGKPKWGFKVKDCEQREIPLPDDLIAELKGWREAKPIGSLILGTAEQHPNSKMLEALKRLVKRAGLSCGHCGACQRQSDRKYKGGCYEYDLHKFRRTYLTTTLRNNIDVRTVQRLAGHSDLESTLRYLRPAEGPELRAKINAIQW